MAYTEWLESSPPLAPVPTPAAVSGVSASNILSQPSVPAALPAAVVDGTAAIPTEGALGAADAGAATIPTIPTAAAGTPAMTATAISPTPNPTPVMPSSPANTPVQGLPMAAATGAVAPGAAEDGDAPYPKSFAEVVELITLGKPIPGIKEIPDTVLAEPENPGVQGRRKPWEKE